MCTHTHPPVKLFCNSSGYSLLTMYFPKDNLKYTFLNTHARMHTHMQAHTQCSRLSPSPKEITTVKRHTAATTCFKLHQQFLFDCCCCIAECGHGVCVWLTRCVCFLPQLSGQLVHQQSQLCLEAVKEGEHPQSSTREVTTHAAGLFLRPCTHHPRQQWHFEQLVAPKGAWCRQRRGFIGSEGCKT